MMRWHHWFGSVRLFLEEMGGGCHGEGRKVDVGVGQQRARSTERWR
jgi:hypothetical protein